MASYQVDVTRDVLKRVSLVPLAGAVSQVWQYFGFKQKKERFWSHHRLILICHYMRACKLLHIRVYNVYLKVQLLIRYT